MALFNRPPNTIHPVAPVGSRPVALPSGSRSIAPNPTQRVQNASVVSEVNVKASPVIRRLPVLRGNGGYVVASHEDHMQHFNSEKLVRATGGDQPMGFGKFSL